MEFLKSEIFLQPVREVGSGAEQSFSAASKVLEMHGDQASISLKESGLSNPSGNLVEIRLLA